MLQGFAAIGRAQQGIDGRDLERSRRLKNPHYLDKYHRRGVTVLLHKSVVGYRFC
jgi:hypothetical protein